MLIRFHLFRGSLTFFAIAMLWVCALAAAWCDTFAPVWCRATCCILFALFAFVFGFAAIASVVTWADAHRNRKARP